MCTQRASKSHSIGGVYQVIEHAADQQLSTYVGKRLFDVVIAALLALLFLPLMVLTAGLVWAEDRRSPFFRQVRIGAGGQRFVLTKFRSMSVGAPNVASSDLTGSHVTRVGRVIRRLSLDELPQLFAILAGSMSLVGPRPALPSQADVLVARQAGRSCMAKPGLTGWAQVNSFAGMSATQKAQLDNFYASRISVVFDLKILLRTGGYLLRKPPVY